MRAEPGVEARVYSGISGTVHASSYLHLPLTMVDVRLAPHAVFAQALPASYGGFLYPLEGDLLVDGPRPEPLRTGQLGWLAEAEGDATNVRLTAGATGSRVMLYAGERQGVPIVTHGPFVGETRADLVRVSQAYAAGHMPRVNELANH